MKNVGKSILVIMMLFSIVVTNAQESKREKMEALKVAFITEKLDLTSKEAKEFWPLYNDFQSKRKELSKNMKGERPSGPPPPPDGGMAEKRHEAPNFDEMTDAQISRFIDEKHKQEQSMLDLKVEYFEKYKTVLPIRKIGKLHQAEKDFRKEVLKKMRENHGK